MEQTACLLAIHSLFGAANTFIEKGVGLLRRR